MKKRGQVYTSRVVVPKSVQHYIGRVEVIRSLRTKDKATAKLRASQWEGHLSALFLHLKREAGELDREQIDALVAEYLAAELHEVDGRLSMGEGYAITAAGPDPSLTASLLSDRAESLSSELANNDLGRTMAAARKLAPAGASERSIAILARRLLEAALQATLEEIRSIEGLPITRSAIRLPSAPATKAKPSGPTLGDFAESFIRRQIEGGHWSPGTQRTVPAKLRLVVELLGKDRLVSSITPADMTALQDTLGFWPKNANKRPDTRGRPAREVIEMVKAAAPGTFEMLSPKTFNETLLWTRTLFKEAVTHELLTRSPAAVLKDRKDAHPSAKRAHFTDEHLAAYLSATEDARESDPAVYWIPRIMSLTGARLGEPAGLTPADIREVDGVLCFDFNERVRKLKSAAAARFVPVHPQLIELGLIEYRDKVAAQEGKGANLFGIVPDKAGSYSNALSKRLAIRRRKAGLPQKVVSESSRNTAMATLSRAGVPLHVIKDLVGHETSSGADAVTLGYIGKTPVSQLAEAVAKLPRLPEPDK